MTYNERWTCINALRVAAAQYRADAKLVGDAEYPGAQRAQEQFKHQALTALALADRLEEAE